MHLCHLKQILWWWFYFTTKVCILWVWDRSTCLNGKIPPQVLSCFLSFSPHLVCISLAYQAELRQRGSDSSLLILLLYFSISMECLPLFAQCCITAGMPFSVLVAGTELQASQESQGVTHAITSPPPHSLPSNLHLNLQQRSLGMGINKGAQIN